MDSDPARCARVAHGWIAGSINNIIFTKLKEVFAALLDAATLAGSWVIVDRTDGSGSATAELLLEMAIERGTQKPYVLVIDSLERLGKGHDGCNSHKILKQLGELFKSGDEYISQDPTGSERDFLFDFQYSVADFESAQPYADVPSTCPNRVTLRWGPTCAFESIRAHA